jgi:hypothetical protein
MHELLQPILDLLSGHPEKAAKLSQIVAWLFACRLFLKAFSERLQRRLTVMVDTVNLSEGDEDDAELLRWLSWWPYVALAFAIDLLFSLKLPTAASLTAHFAREKAARFSPPPPSSRTSLIPCCLAMLGLSAALLCAGCKSPEVAAYRTVGGVAATVDAAMNAWGDWVRAGKATADDETRVRSAYIKYQNAMQVAKAAVLSAKEQPATAAPYSVIVSTLAASADPLVELIYSFVPQPGK